jgi:hypothetical protein
MDKRVWHGHWWIPGKPESRKPGVLTADEDGKMTLELIGGFDLSIQEVLPNGITTVSSRIRSLPVIHGEAEGKLLTLMDSFTTLSRGGMFFSGEPTFHRLHVNRAMVGVHLEGLDERIFRGAVCRFENLTTWLDNDAVRHGFDWDEDEAEAHLKAIPTETVTIEGWKIEARTINRGFQFEATRGALGVRGAAEALVVITPPEPVAAAAFDSLVLEITDLLTLASGNASGLISLTLIHCDDQVVAHRGDEPVTKAQEIESIAQRIHRARPTEPATDNHRMRFTCKDLAFSTALMAWTTVRRQCQPACNVFFGLAYARPGYTELRLLSIAIATEALHRDLYGNVTDMTREAFTDLRDRLLATVTDPTEQAWVRKKLRNEPSYRERLHALAAVPPAQALSVVIPDVTAWAGNLVQARNGLAHTAGKGLGGDIFSLEQQSTALFTLVLLNAIGLPEDVLIRVAQEQLAPY